MAADIEAVILSIGDELVLGQSVDTNSAWLSARLAARGVMTRYHRTVADDTAAIAGALREAASAPLVLVTGGLGPTEDDLTREALAAAMGVPLELDAEALRRIEGFFRILRRPMPVRNRVQAMCPRGAALLENDRGTAPGIRARLGESLVFVMPGVPYEMAAMYERHVAPMLSEQAGRVIVSEVVRTFGLGESDAAARLGELMERDRNPRMGTTVAGGVVSVRIRAEAADPAEAARRVSEAVEMARRRLGDAVFGMGDTTMAQAVVRRLRAGARTVATAESCTGGLIGRLLTDVAGASAVYRGGWIVYSNDLKRSELGVAGELLEREGAVSRPVAEAMASAALSRGGADFGVAVTGVAGPDGGTTGKPVGTVWIALARREHEGVSVDAREYRFPGDRERIRERTALAALDMLRRTLPAGVDE